MYYNNKQQDTSTKREGSPSRFTLPPISSTTHVSTPLPPLPKRHEPTAFFPYQQQQQQHQQHQQQTQRQSSHTQHQKHPTKKSTYSYSPYLESNDHIVMQQHEEYYYPVYSNTTSNSKPVWSEDAPPTIDHPKLKKKNDMDERMAGTNREFIENREILYEEKLKQLQDELVAIEKGNHEMYNEHLADLEEKRQKMIHDARLMMIYQISSVDQEFDMNNKLVQEECLAERRELQNAMFTVIEEKRKKLKEDKDGEGELGLSTHHTRNKQRLLRKRGEILDGYLTAQQQSLSSPVISIAILCFYSNGLFQGHCLNTINNESPYSFAGKLIDHTDPKHNDCMEPDDFYSVLIQPYDTQNEEIIPLLLRRPKNNDAAGLSTHEHEEETNNGYQFTFETSQFLSGQQAMTFKNKYFVNNNNSSGPEEDDQDLIVCIGNIEFKKD
ncbi:hypothetical protein MBANPS3_010715 [Mucor bainieri]